MPKSKNSDRMHSDLLLNELPRAISILRSINWDFFTKGTLSAREVRPFNCRRHHWFPATFVAEIPYTLIEVLTRPGAVVYDPFAGIGTTYFQALLLNRRPIASEICKVAVEYMRSLFVLFNPRLNLDQIKENVLRMRKEFNPSFDYTSNVPATVLIHKLRPWYSKATLNQLSFLFIREADCGDNGTEAVLRISISALLKAASSQQRGWGCIADNMLPRRHQMRDANVFDLLAKQVNNLLLDISQHLGDVSSGYAQLYKELSRKQTILYADARETDDIPANSVDLVVTSPPYPNMADYVTSQRLSYYFIGSDLIRNKGLRDLHLEIGARNRRARKDSLQRYLADMSAANETISRKIKDGGYACYVMPVFNSDNENNSNRE